MTTAPSSSAALTVLSHSACQAGLDSAAMEAFRDETERQNISVRRNAIVTRMGTPLFREAVPDPSSLIVAWSGVKQAGFLRQLIRKYFRSSIRSSKCSSGSNRSNRLPSPFPLPLVGEGERG